VTLQLDTKRVALAGNPNTGKTTLFNRLTGGRAKVGNYPGITVEREVGRLQLEGVGRVELEDVPGTYSLSARSAEEQVAIQALAGLPPHEEPDAVLLVADATQLTRNLYLALQVIELDLPLVIALNMTDMLAARGQTVDAAAASRALGVPVVAISAHSGAGVDQLEVALARVLEHPEAARPGPRWVPDDAILAADVRAVEQHVPEAWHKGSPARRRALAQWALLSLDEADELHEAPSELRQVVLRRRVLARAAKRDIETEIVRGRYGWIDAHAAAFLREPATKPKTLTDRVDRVLLHPALGFAVFLLTMGVVFQSLFSWANPAIGWIEALFGAVQGWVEGALPSGLLTDLLVQGVIEGVGSVVVFLPQILLLFFFIVLMEDSGYMARVAFLMDRLMKSIGLHGRAFVPMMSGFACAVPAILATRTMERRRDRLLTMLVVPLMTCSARLPVYTLLIGALFPPEGAFGLPLQGLLMVGMYLFSTLLALVVAAVLGRTMFRGPRVPFLLEMPPYRMPTWGSVTRSVWRRAQVFLNEAGTVILLCTIAMWALLSFPRHSPELDSRARAIAVAEQEGRSERAIELERERDSIQLAQSYGGRLGRAIEPALEPLGFDWKIGIGLIGAFAAREVFVSTMGVVYGIGSEVDGQSVGLRQKLRQEQHADGRPVYTPLVGLSLMVFFALACQCMSTVAVVKRETHGWLWPVFLFTYTGVLAWIASFAVYQGGRLLGFQ
jgi:ferrous iron transport protein B